MDEFIYDRTKGKFRSFLAKIAHNCAMQIYSLKKKNSNIPAQPISIEYPAEVDVNMMEEYRDFLLELALENLRLNVDTETYQVFYMSFIQQCSIEEISAVTRKTPNNIYVIKSRCLNKLTALLREFRQLDEDRLPYHSNKNKSEY
jgi:DNA-directed RNA polymerase specialized sigma24 family protein